MIDTDKYEGHTEGPWVAEHMYWRKKGSHGGGLREEGAEDAGNYAESFVYTEAYLYAEDDEDDLDIPTLDWASCVNGVVIRNMATANLVADAPLLLAEVKQLREELKQTRESLWWCYDNYRFDSHTMVDTDWNFIGNLLGADMESEEK